jgi:agmatinase
MDNFLGLSKQDSDHRRARYAVLPVPYDATTSFQTGTRWGPRAIITASQQVELFDPEYEREVFGCGVATLDPLEPDAVPEQMHETVYKAAKAVLRAGKFLITLGGEHSISSGLIRAVRERHKNLSVLQIDAHADLRPSYHGTPYSHACVMRRVWKMGVPVVGVGIRNYSIEEHRFMKKQGILPITPEKIRANPDWIVPVLAGLSEEVYITIDIDGLDPAYAPGTGTPEPGGLDWWQVTDLLRTVAAQRTIVAADLVEVIPQPGSMQTEFLAAKLIYKLIAHLEANR